MLGFHNEKSNKINDIINVEDSDREGSGSRGFEE